MVHDWYGTRLCCKHSIVNEYSSRKNQDQTHHTCLSLLKRHDDSMWSSSHRNHGWNRRPQEPFSFSILENHLQFTKPMNFWEETHGCLLSKNVDHEKPYRSSISKVQKEVWYQASLPKKLDEWGIVFASLSSKKPSNSSSRTGWPWEFKLLPSMRKNHRNQPFLVKTAVGNLWMELFGSPLFGAPSLLDSTPFFHTGGPFGKSWSGVRQCLRLGDMVCSHGELQQLTKSIRFWANMGRNMLSSGRNMLSSWAILQGV